MLELLMLMMSSRSSQGTSLDGMIDQIQRLKSMQDSMSQMRGNGSPMQMLSLLPQFGQLPQLMEALQHNDAAVNAPT